mmetsp:Transcript_22663/g.56002  ORF Transcript_22663/g.56002 Transcript_22663/m.56002 type:complete len:394 (+) Transcript_22663:92-1273(+)|eukprot:CAMPEP_0113645918 /NCGR_PEP_ID=MMETSP0017_2-20120614/24224_1 /TAXON_ID=2856 /ORGANISM="Cylindrotheca closterium" /LENGTH=393 /DNA_ID=CAMNT_0000557721 /DNA_START=25 /DNA_END=1206 /DNA_ORIENTATION=- /assembly_acc=CAM_ASM_000147
MSQMDDDDSSILDLADQVNRPPDVAIQQQRIKAWHPILDPEWMIYGYLILAVILIPLGFKLKTISDETVELHSIYDAKDQSLIDKTQTSDCRIGMSYNQNKTCTIQFEAPEDMEPPIMIYYELNNFHQNHRFYSRSRDSFQLNGKVGDDRDPTFRALCEPMDVLGGKTLNPCGFVANTFFNDKISLIGGNDEDGLQLEMSEEGIAWQSDLEFKFRMPEGFQTKECPTVEDCSGNSTCCQDNGFSCSTPALSKKDEKCYAYDYPEADTTRYLYETYPDMISPLEHVTNEHFVVWMRTETRPKFRKLYGWINQKIPKGEKIEFEIWSNYVVESFSGHKALIATTTNLFGGKNKYIGVTFFGLGFTFLFFGIIFAIKHWFRPRRIADRKYLHYKQE